jgi:hypothetical protein
VIRMRSSKARAMIVLSAFTLVFFLGQDIKAEFAWHLRKVPPAYQDIAFGNGVFVIVDEGSRILTSPDGKVWSESLSARGKDIIRVAYVNGIFVAWSRGFLFSSTDGNTWEEMGPAPLCIAEGDCLDSGVECAINSMTYGADTYVAVCSSGRMFSSPDGINWLQCTATSPEGLREGLVVYGNGTFVAIGVSGTALVSTDGIQWTDASAMPPETEYTLSYNLSAVVFGHGLFVAVGTGSHSTGSGKFDIPELYSLVFTSPDGLNWTQILPEGTPPGLFDVAYGNSQFAAVGFDGLVVTSRDGFNWVAQNVYEAGNNQLNAISFGKNTFVSVGEKSTILQSDFLLNNCAATLSAGFLDFPIIKVGNAYYQAFFWSAEGPYAAVSDFQGGPTGQVDDLAPFNDCEPPTVTCIGPICKLHVPEIAVIVAYSHEPQYALYRVDFQLLQAPGFLLKLISYEPL